MPTVNLGGSAGHMGRVIALVALLATAAFVGGCVNAPGDSEPPASPPAIGSGKVTLQWARPTSNEDGSALTDLAGYRVYYGQSSSLLDKSVDVHGATVSSVEIQGLASGRWYFAIASYNAAGIESSKSGVVTTTI